LGQQKKTTFLYKAKLHEPKLRDAEEFFPAILKSRSIPYSTLAQGDGHYRDRLSDAIKVDASLRQSNESKVSNESQNWQPSVS